jgi:hypothetical protein
MELILAWREQRRNMGITFNKGLETKGLAENNSKKPPFSALIPRKEIFIWL